ncbi:MAG TPA: CPBP family glutamic-type intramembrane protease [Anaerolineae bacterium]|nr:CPBP family glutamic-type intramembrane protease [Anaerolineae bacterium]
MLELLVFLPFLVPVVVANLSERHRHTPYTTADPGTTRLVDNGLRVLPYILLAALNVSLLGVAALALLNALAQQLMPGVMEETAMELNWGAVAVASLLTGILAFVPLIAGVRRWLARVLPIDPESPVHMTALVLAVYMIGLSLAQMALIGSLENLAGAGLELTAWDVLLSGLPLLIFGLLGVGIWIRRGVGATAERLGLLRPTWKQLLAALVVTALLLGLDLVVNLLWAEVDPFGYELMDRVMRSLFGGLGTVVGAIVLGLSAGISEEILFRGAVQPRLGLVLAAVLFTIGHLQYSLTPATLEVLIIGLILGLVRKRSNTTVCIIIHALYNMTGALLGAW